MLLPSLMMLMKSMKFVMRKKTSVTNVTLLLSGKMFPINHFFSRQINWPLDSNSMAAMIGASKGRTIGIFGKEAAGRSNSAELLNKSPGRSRYATPGRPLIVDLMAFDTQ